MRGISHLTIPAMVIASLAAAAILHAPPAYARKKKAAPTPTATPVPTPMPTPAPEVKQWNFDQDKADAIAQGWTAVEGDWVVLSDPTAPSPPNGFGLAAGREVKSLMNGLNYSVLAVISDPTEYSDFTLETAFKAKKGWFDCSGGLVFRYADPKNYYVLSAGCPSDYFALTRVSNGNPETLKQTVVPLDQGVWYQLKVVADGEHLSCYSNDKMAFDVSDSKIKRGRIGLWALNDSQPLFDNVKLTLAPGTGAESGTSGGEAPSGAPPAAPPRMPGAPGSLRRRTSAVAALTGRKNRSVQIPPAAHA